MPKPEQCPPPPVSRHRIRVPFEPAFTAADVATIVAEAGVAPGEHAERWAAELGTGGTPRPPLEWAAVYVNMAVTNLRWLWRVQRRERPAALERWARAVEERALAFIAAFGVDTLDAPAERHGEAGGAIEALTLLAPPGRLTEDLSPQGIGEMDALTPFLVAMCPRSVRRAHTAEVDEELALIGSSGMVAPEMAHWFGVPVQPQRPPPQLWDALRMAVAGAQLAALRARTLAARAHANRGKKEPDRALLRFAREVCDVYVGLSGVRATVRTDPVTNARGGPAVAFYQAVARRVAERLPPPADADERALAAALRGRVRSAETAAGDVRDARGGSRRKR
jgi:hypothetical protein